MRVGIYTHYAHCDAAYFAVRLADFLQSQGADFGIFSDATPGKLKCAYDNGIMHKRKIRFTDWAKQYDSVIWTNPPKIEQINYAKRQGICTLIVPMWQELTRPFRKVMQRADHVIAMSTECRELFATVYKFRNVTLIPFDPGLPVTKKHHEIDGRSVKIFLPWFDRNARCANSYFLGLLGFLLERMPDAQLTVAITSCRFSPAVAKFFTTLGKKTNGRVRLIRNVPVTKRPGLYMDHDITLFSAECDNYGLCSLTSLYCGTPVLSFALSPQLDFVHSDSNGFLVKTQIDYDENGVPHAVPDYQKFMSVLQTMIAEPWHINNLNKKVNYNLAARKRAFEVGWQTILRLG